MKKLLLITCSLLIFVSCSSDDDSNDLTCTQATDNAASALSNYAQNTSSTDLCNAYKSALEQQKTACGDPSGTIQGIIDGLGDCTESPILDIPN